MKRGADLTAKGCMHITPAPLEIPVHAGKRAFHGFSDLRLAMSPAAHAASAGENGGSGGSL